MIFQNVDVANKRLFMLKRKASEATRNWIDTKDRKCLVV